MNLRNAHSATLIIIILISFETIAANQSYQSFSKAKKSLDKQVYLNNRETIYCGATFDSRKKLFFLLALKLLNILKDQKK